ncbi:hypothetical protein PM10SUCC1_06850 [Propionigenium maris DSM 9537]|uniref:ADP-heptose:LPS heptosyltransferase n=1 Tax=Propionigenium maris DSM 9537 TaxID=1123000 RepID=A0A9W6GJL4_9FUSO|nr:glycosyltransferase family 9 protein [Propionigenium maris]GLI55170.1 hypothetical protein PM10SUCC1_06850 [Propionigenium maris DSM 9537]
MNSLKGFFIRKVGNKKSHPFDLNAVKTLYIKCGRIGDTVVKTPFIKLIKEKYPHIEITACGVGGAEKILEANPYITNVIASKGEKSKIRFVRIIKDLAHSLRERGKYDLCFNLGNSVNFFKLLSLRLLKAKLIIGGPKLEKYGLKSTELTLINRYIHFTQRHSCYKWLEVAEHMDIEVDSYDKYRYDIHIPEEIQVKHRDYYNDKEINLVFNFRGSSDRKSLPWEDVEYFLREISEVDQRVCLHLMAPPLFYCEAEKIIKKLNIKNVRMLPKTESILEAAELLKGADMLFSVDTGVVHMASAFDIPMVVIYPNNPDTLVEYSPRCSNFKIITAPEYTGNNIEGYNLDEVMTNIQEMLNFIH